MCAQAAVRGAVLDSTGRQVLEDATVTLFKMPKSDLLKSVRNKKGFLFNDIPGGKYLLKTSYQGYLTESFYFSKDSGVVRRIVLLRRKTELLSEVMVKHRISELTAKSRPGFSIDVSVSFFEKP